LIYIYALLCPKTDEIRYIGKCKNPATRLAAHISKARTGQTKHHCANWVASLLRDQLSPVMVIVDTLPNDADWQSAEMAAIRLHRESGHRLTNTTSGGDGFHDVHPDVLVKRGKSRSRFLSDPENKARHLAMCREVQAKPEVKQKHKESVEAHWADPCRRDAMLASMRTPQAIKNRSAAAKNRHLDPEFAAAHQQRMRDLMLRPGRLEQILAAGMKGRTDPEVQVRRIAAMKAAHQTDEVKAKMRLVGAEIGARPEVKAARSAASARNWADPDFKARVSAAISAGKTRRRAERS